MTLRLIKNRKLSKKEKTQQRDINLSNKLWAKEMKKKKKSNAKKP